MCAEQSVVHDEADGALLFPADETGGLLEDVGVELGRGGGSLHSGGHLVAQALEHGQVVIAEHAVHGRQQVGGIGVADVGVGGVEDELCDALAVGVGLGREWHGIVDVDAVEGLAEYQVVALVVDDVNHPEVVHEYVHQLLASSIGVSVDGDAVEFYGCLLPALLVVVFAAEDGDEGVAFCLIHGVATGEIAAWLVVGIVEHGDITAFESLEVHAVAFHGCPGKDGGTVGVVGEHQCGVAHLTFYHLNLVRWQLRPVVCYHLNADEAWCGTADAGHP